MTAEVTKTRQATKEKARDAKKLPNEDAVLRDLNKKRDR
jgi:hypothetical protein